MDGIVDGIMGGGGWYNGWYSVQLVMNGIIEQDDGPKKNSWGSGWFNGGD